jgi:hypothetical protein
MKRWGIIAAVVVGFGALVAAGGLWAPPLLQTAIDNQDTVDVVTPGLQVVNGTGIRKEVMPHIFEPFFTTKDHEIRARVWGYPPAMAS